MISFNIVDPKLVKIMDTEWDEDKSIGYIEKDDSGQGKLVMTDNSYRMNLSDLCSIASTMMINVDSPTMRGKRQRHHREYWVTIASILAVVTLSLGTFCAFIYITPQLYLLQGN